MGFNLRFTDKEITAWSGMSIMKRSWITSDLMRHSRRLGCHNQRAIEAIAPNN